MRVKKSKTFKQMTKKELLNVNGGMNVVGWGGAGSEVSRWAKAWKAVVDMMY